jgi:beta-mannosidase
MEQLLLSDGWRWKRRTTTISLEQEFAADDGWLTATVPGTVHQELLAAGRIPDPFFGLQENDAQWVGEQDWLYRCDFDVPAFMLDAASIVLLCEGLDTFVTAWLNGQSIFANDNMFLPLRIDIREHLRAENNTLCLLFESPLGKGRERETLYGKRTVWNGDSSRVYVRKAQYHYGWDWGPTLLTMGPWRPVRIEAYDMRIADVYANIALDENQKNASINLQIDLETLLPLQDQQLTIDIDVLDPTGSQVTHATQQVTNTNLRSTITIVDPQLWWPRGYGAQSLYRLVVTVQAIDRVLHRYEQRLGLRTIRLIQEPLEGETGTTFLFEVNGIPVFCGGANWIPADMLLSRLTNERYRAWLQHAASANMLMLRVWGGGIYEDDYFYETCDELGLLVWQDFMFACGIYPRSDWFLDSVRMEAQHTVRRLRHHPCMALWCGNNEDYSIAESADADPARALYEELLPSICADLDPATPYWPGSPFGGTCANDQTVGDRHTWEIWHNPTAPYQAYDRYWGRFVSEFGMESAPSMPTIESFTTPMDRYPQSRVFEHHNKSTDGVRRLAFYLSDTLRAPTDMASYIYATQFVQAEAMASAIRAWRRRWRGSGRYSTSGALVWQLNDCWPAISWALLDVDLHPKAAYYAVRRELAPISIALSRDEQEMAALWAVNATTEPLATTVVIKRWNLHGQLLETQTQNVELSPLGVTECVSLPWRNDHQQVLSVQLRQEDRVIARATLWPEPFKYLTLPDPEVRWRWLDEYRLLVEASLPAKGVMLSADTEIIWSDNYLDLLPGDPQILFIEGPRPSAINIIHMR